MTEPLDIPKLRALLEKAAPVESSVTTPDTMRFYAAMHNAAPQLLDAAQHMTLARKEAGCPDDDTLVMHCRELRADRDAALKRCAELLAVMERIRTIGAAVEARKIANDLLNP